ncbi:flagellar protein FliT [Sedimenticola selenatireducens]|uniref:Flagellar protein FliT n=1 Tax=Sedimenticola selenatireducens TaxID=191960 RepID=A0A557SCZ4_9GAMM|nr:flagellar protein FliT [Sedimenticola selenatireducens]TVO75288.1 flagellar protein FliT [Sedimenticola selenatireducens]TVT66859.1 MAG: flagellar protein FliT [Sedimenticola selenatireducens]
MIEQILDLSQAMLSLAQDGEWEQVGALQQKRQQLVTESFPLDVDHMNHAETASQIQSILYLDKQLLHLASVQQKEISAALGKLNHGRQATKAYHTNARS